MNPFFFGTRQRKLFGLYTPACAGGASARAAVLCAPWGQEYLRAHRSMRHLGDLLTRAHVHVLRFDYFGTGDSSGELEDAELGGWQSDIGLAIDELKDTTGVAQVGLVGLRLGATLAAAVASARPDDIERLVLWDPVVDGREYVGELSRAASGTSETDGTLEVLGFPLTERMARELGATDLLEVAPALPERTLVIASQPLASHRALRGKLTSRAGGPVAYEEIPAAPAWLEERNIGVGAIPVPVLQRIVQWWG
jgi:pimeloyl-ACP methyl ester carboxylesterase